MKANRAYFNLFVPEMMPGMFTKLLVLIIKSLHLLGSVWKINLLLALRKVAVAVALT